MVQNVKKKKEKKKTNILPIKELLDPSVTTRRNQPKRSLEQTGID